MQKAAHPFSLSTFLLSITFCLVIVISYIPQTTAMQFTSKLPQPPPRPINVTLLPSYFILRICEYLNATEASDFLTLLLRDRRSHNPTLFNAAMKLADARSELGRNLIEILYQEPDQEDEAEIFALICNANLRIRNELGNTALHMAAANASPEIVRALIKHGAPIHAKNYAGATALYCAFEYKNPNGNDLIRKLLLAAGAQIAPQPPFGKSILEIVDENPSLHKWLPPLASMHKRQRENTKGSRRKLRY